MARYLTRQYAHHTSTVRVRVVLVRQKRRGVHGVPVRFLEPDGMERGVKEGSSSFPPQLPSNAVQVRGGVVWGWGILGNVASCRLCGACNELIIVRV